MYKNESTKTGLLLLISYDSYKPYIMQLIEAERQEQKRLSQSIEGAKKDCTRLEQCLVYLAK